VLDGFKYRVNLLALLILTPFELIQSPRQFFMGSEELAQPYEGSHNRDIDLNRAFTEQNRGEHGYSLFREGIWEIAPATPIIA
jgi:hypothetical protein